MTPEQRAKRVQRDYLLTDQQTKDMARRFRAAENAGYERAAKRLDARATGVAARGKYDLALWIRGDAEIVRALKARATRARRSK